MISRLVHTGDFRRLLATAPRSRSAHFALHHVHGTPATVNWRKKSTNEVNLSTGAEQIEDRSVDNLLASAQDTGLWVGVVVPKRHAKRAVTRNLIKRQSYSAALRHAHSLLQGLWLVRLRAAFPVAQFRSASSQALRLTVQSELEQLFGRAGR
jgi:ribonuclease P protein component